MEKKQVVVFDIDKYQYGINISNVVEIIMYQSVREIPKAPDYVEGIINLRGEVYPIINCRKRFALHSKQSDENTKIILVRYGESQFGIVVDNVSEIVLIEQESIEPTPKIIDIPDTKYIEGITKRNENMILLLNIDSLIKFGDKDILAAL